VLYRGYLHLLAGSVRLGQIAGEGGLTTGSGQSGNAAQGCANNDRCFFAVGFE